MSTGLQRRADDAGAHGATGGGPVGSAPPAAAPSPLHAAWQRTVAIARLVRDRVPGLRVVLQAAINYIVHQSANQAGSVAFSSVLSMFPMLLFLSTLAAFIGEPGSAAELVNRVVEFAPPVVADALRPVIDEVLRQRNRALLAIGIVVTTWTASSGTQAIRTALNKAYGIEKGLPFWSARIKVTIFTIVGTLAILFVFSSTVILPYLWTALEQGAGGPLPPWLRDGVRYGLAFVVLTIVYASMYAWLPDLRQRWRTVLPGAVAGALLWLVAAALLSTTLRTATQLTLVYGSFAGLVATLVFLYANAATLIFGAEINGVLRAQGRGPYRTAEDEATDLDRDPRQQA